MYVKYADFGCGFDGFVLTYNDWIVYGWYKVSFTSISGNSFNWFYKLSCMFKANGH